MKRLLLIGLLLLCVLGTVFANGSKEADSSVGTGFPAMTLKLGHIAAPDQPYALGAIRFAELVSDMTDGKVTVEVFHSSQLGSAKSLIEGVQFGTIDMALIGTAELSNFEPKIAVFDLPFLFTGTGHFYESLDTVGMEIGQSLESKGMKLLGFMMNGVRHMTNNVRPIKTPQDTKGLKIRVQNSKVFIELIKALGASPIPMAFSELYTALQTGTVDGQENPSAHIWNQRFYEVQKYASLTAHVYSAEPFLMSMSKWSTMSPELQQIIMQAASESGEYARALSDSLDTDYWDKIIATGKISVNEVDLEPFQKATSGVIEMFADQVGRDNLAKINALAK
jgi:TRAP-type transport system periplasmic protein